jgi:NTE family protein
VLRALHERGIVPDLIVGTSGGAIDGAFIASRRRRSRQPTSWPRSDAASDAGRCFHFVRSAAHSASWGRDHLVPESGLRRLIVEHTTHDRLEQMPDRCHLVAVDVLTGKELLLSRGPALEAVLASAAIPPVLPSVAWEGRAVMDGGVALTRRSRTRWRSEPERCTCSRPDMRARLSSRRRARRGWRCTR